MANNIHWQVPFMSKLGTLYTVNIYDPDYTGEPVELIGAPVPFETSEEDDDSIFECPLRAQTGYIRIIDEDGSFLEQIVPSNNLQRYVTLTSGTTVKWQGFLRAQAFEQEWSNGARMLEFPVHDLISAMSDVHLDTSVNGHRNIAYFLGKYLQTINVLTSTTTISTIYAIDSRIHVSGNYIFKDYINAGIFFDKEETCDEGSVVRNFVGASYADVFSNICTLHGLTLRTIADRIYIVAPDARDSQNTVPALCVTWQNLLKMAATRYEYVDTVTVSDGSLLDYVDYMKVDSSQAYILGAKDVSLEFSFDTDLHMLDLPECDSDTSEVFTPVHTGYDVVNPSDQEQHPEKYELHANIGGNLIYLRLDSIPVQPHSPRSNTYETFHFSEYECEDRQGYSVGTFYHKGSSSYSACNQMAAFRFPTNAIIPDEEARAVVQYDPGYSRNYHAFCGAFPCRWAFYENGTSAILKNGLFLETLYIRNSTTPADKYMPIYSIKTSSEFALKDGYINIDFNLESFWSSILENAYNPFYTASGNLDHLKKFVQHPGQERGLAVGLSITGSDGTHYWSGSQWQESEAYFFIDFERNSTSIATNKTESMLCEANSGWLIPVDSLLTGVVKLTIYSMCNSTRNCRNHILSNLDVSFYGAFSTTASDRKSNRYYKRVLLNGFSDSIELSTNVGTFNNNIYSPNFLTDYDYNYKTSAVYQVNGQSLTQRPEIRLRERMAAYYKKSRHVYSPVGHFTGNLYHSRYIMNGRVFMAIDKNHNWRDEEQTIKFIEVADGFDS